MASGKKNAPYGGGGMGPEDEKSSPFEELVEDVAKEQLELARKYMDVADKVLDHVLDMVGPAAAAVAPGSVAERMEAVKSLLTIANIAADEALVLSDVAEDEEEDE